MLAHVLVWSARKMSFVYIPSGWQANASIMPAPPPAMRFTAAPGGALPSFPCTLVAMAVVCLLLFFRLGNGPSVWLAPVSTLAPTMPFRYPKYLTTVLLSTVEERRQWQSGEFGDKKEDEE